VSFTIVVGEWGGLCEKNKKNNEQKEKKKKRKRTENYNTKTVKDCEGEERGIDEVPCWEKLKRGRGKRKKRGEGGSGGLL